MLRSKATKGQTPGNGAVETTGLDSGLRVKARSVATGGVTVWRMDNVYANNGNVRRQTVSGTGEAGAYSYQQDFTYDGMNRMRTMNDSGASGCSVGAAGMTGTFTQVFVYDRWGNRGLLTGSCNPGGNAAAVVNVETAAAVEQQFGNNTLGMSNVDGGGNVQTVPGKTLAYDTENRMVSSSETTSGTTTEWRYSYDGDGRRVRREKWVNGERVEGVNFVYGASGEMVGEYTGASGVIGGPVYLTADHLGTTRMTMKEGAAGVAAVVSRYDYLPFGEEIGTLASSGRSGVGGYGADAGVRWKFTGKERDGETGLDYFEARYFSAAQGRFTSPDLPFFDQRPNDPQSWNLYTYGRNNPLSFFDPSGRCSIKPGGSAATGDPGEPCVKQGDTSVTVSAKGGDPDEARIAQFMILTNVALNTQLREAKDIGISTYAGQAIGFGVGKFIAGPVINAVATRIAAQRALAAASGAASGARAGRVWIAAYDVETGAVAVGHSGPVPNASSIHPELLGKLDDIGGLGAKNSGATGAVGCCGEVDAANQLPQRGSKLENIGFTDAIRPKTGEVIPRCSNCQVVFGSGKN